MERLMLEANLEALQTLLPKLAGEAGKYGLMRDKKLVQVFDSAADAHIFAHEKYKDDNYSVHRVSATAINLGHHSTLI